MHQAALPLHGPRLSAAALLDQTPHWKNSVLGAFCFSADAAESREKSGLGIPCIHVPMPRLDAGETLYEIWHGNGELLQGRCEAIHYRHDDDLLFGAIALPELDTDNGKTPLQQAAESAYHQVFALLDTLRFPHPFRFWNYIADINTHSFGMERYHQFNLGRQDAFLAHGRGVVGNVPAACALGSTHGPLTIAFLAGRAPPLNIENPRQTSAYLYPKQYGPRSPTFSRASLVHLGQHQVLFISGTASVVGHVTLHPADVVAQTRETMANIEAVLTEANRLTGQSAFDPARLPYRVYVRRAADLAEIRAELSRHVGDTLDAVYLQADVCRSDLLLEIEATAAVPLASAPGQRNRA